MCLRRALILSIDHVVDRKLLLFEERKIQFSKVNCLWLAWILATDQYWSTAYIATLSIIFFIESSNVMVQVDNFPCYTRLSDYLEKLH